jgi:hypothetical protein
VGQAELEIKRLILDIPVQLTEEYYVPEYACGRIIGRSGVNIKDIQKMSNCQVKVVDGVRKSCSTFSTGSASSNQISHELINTENSSVAKRIVTIQGGAEEIALAKVCS